MSMIEKIKEFRAKTGSTLIDAKNYVEEADGDVAKAVAAYKRQSHHWNSGDRFREIEGGRFRGTVVAVDYRCDGVAVIYDVSPSVICLVRKDLIKFVKRKVK